MEICHLIHETTNTLSTQHVLAQIHFIIGSKTTHLVSQDIRLEVKQNNWILAKGVSTSNIPGSKVGQEACMCTYTFIRCRKYLISCAQIT